MNLLLGILPDVIAGVLAASAVLLAVGVLTTILALLEVRLARLALAIDVAALALGCLAITGMAVSGYVAVLDQWADLESAWHSSRP